MREQWESIDGFPSYLISNKGRVKSRRTLRCLKPYFNGNHLRVKLRDEEGNPEQLYIDKLVVETFLDPGLQQEAFYVVNHIDGNNRNNRTDNLTIEIIHQKPVRKVRGSRTK